MRSQSARPEDYRQRRVLVVGLGLHGGAASAIRWFLRAGATVRVTDIRDHQTLAPTVNRLKKYRIIYRLGRHDPADFRWADVIYQNQGVPDTLPELKLARRLGKRIVNETSLFFQLCPAKIIGITGTRGKSTTAALLTDILQCQDKKHTFVSGNIRLNPMLDLLPQLSAADRVVLELSSFQLEFLPLIKKSPAVAVMTNLMIDHLNRYDSLTTYAAAKYNIFRWQTSDDLAVLNADDRWTRAAAKLTMAKIWWFQTSGQHHHHGITVRNGWIVEYHGAKTEKLFPQATINVLGEHNLKNNLAAIAVARAENVPVKIIRQAVKKFIGLQHRQEIIRQWRGHTFINDTSATTPDGTLAALKMYPGGVYIIGGTDKRLRFNLMMNEFRRRQLPFITLPGTATDKMVARLPVRDRHLVHAAADMIAAVRQALKLAKPGQPIVLSPGAASFGPYVHEFERGQKFVKAVRSLK